MTVLSVSLYSDAERLLRLMEPVLRTAAGRTLDRRFPAWVIDDALQVARMACWSFAGRCRDGVALPAFLGIVALRECLRERCSYADGWVLPRQPATDGGVLDSEGLDECCDSVPSAEECVMQTAEMARLQAAVATLKPNLRETIVRRFGLNGRDPATLRQLAAEAGVGIRTVWEREQRALVHLKKLLADYSTNGPSIAT